MPKTEKKSKLRLTKEQKNNIANNLRRFRMAKFPQNDGQKRCAAAMGVEPYQYAPWEEGVRTPCGKNIALIAGYFGISIEQLIGGPDGAKPVHEDVAPIRKRGRGRPSRQRTGREAAHGGGETVRRAVKTMSIPIPAALNVEVVNLTYEGEFSLVGIEFLNKAK